MSNVIPLHLGNRSPSLPRPQAPARRLFPTILNVIAFDLPRLAATTSGSASFRLSSTDIEHLEEFFAWFGIEIDVDGPLESLSQGLAYFGSEIGAAAVYRVEYPQQFQALYPHWSGTQLAYLDAVVSANWSAARALVRNTPFLDRAHARMTTRAGSALRLPRRLALAHG